MWNLFLQKYSMDIISIVLVALVSATEGYECEKTAAECETTLVIQHRMTMMHTPNVKVFSFAGKIYRYDVNDPANASPVPTDEVMTADGWENERLVVVANESLPGPPIIVYEGQRLKVHVINKLLSDTVTIHWHGIPQNDSPWMDGVPFVTQCPILPGQTFTYDFVTRPKGTYWYHSHSGPQRAKGLSGALVIRERTNEMMEHIMTVQGWNHDWDSDMDTVKDVYGNFQNRKLIPRTRSLDGVYSTSFYLTSVLINGRGRYYTNMSSGEHNGAPLTVFTVEPNVTYRFRVINVGAAYPMRVSVDDHDLTLIASDGHDFQPVKAESFVIQSGERYDFTLTANKEVSNYWIRAETLEVRDVHKTEAILHYVGAGDNEPVTSKRSCIPNDHCLVINCPFYGYPLDFYTDCKRLDDLRSSNNDSAPEPMSADTFKEFFLNFAFPSSSFISSINGKQFNFPKVSALTQPYEIDSTCDKEDCGVNKICTCTHSISVNHNDVVQLVLLNVGQIGPAHPVHLHGYSFYVLKMAYGRYNATTARLISMNSDIECLGNGDRAFGFCNNGTWADRSWLGNNVPDLQLSNPIRKDTLIIPSGGYAVIRIKANNPGVWLLHCHLQPHIDEGMTMILNNSYGRHPVPPKGFPVCHSYPSLYREQHEELKSTPATTTGTWTTGLRETSDDGYGMKTFWIVFAVFGLVLLFLLAYILHLRKEVKHKEERLSKYTSTTSTGKDTMGVKHF